MTLINNFMNHWQFQKHWLRLIRAHMSSQGQIQTSYCFAQWKKVEVVIEESTITSIKISHSALLYTLSYMIKVILEKPIGYTYKEKEILSSHFETMLKLSACLGLKGHIQKCSHGCILCKVPIGYSHQILLEGTNRIHSKRRQKRYSQNSGSRPRVIYGNV